MVVVVVVFFFQTKKLVMHLIDYFHITNVPTKPTDKASSVIHMASSLLHVDIQPAIVVAHPVNGATILSITYI